MRRFLALLLGGVLVAGCAAPRPAAPPPTAPLAADALPLDPNVRTGRLSNGLTYYVRANDEPESRAMLRLVVNAGSVLETAEQQGVAHFLEHMLFNGTRRFPEQALVDFLERTGMRFGADVNAYTSFDETVYMLELPTDTAGILEKGLDVLEDWAGAATLDPAEIDKERGVVVEEWRVRQQNAQGRIQEQILPVLLAGSAYKDRLPIGLPEVIRSVSPETVRRFYETWYRPDLMAVVAVGDFDASRVEALIRERFSRLERPADAPPRPALPLPPQPGTRFKVATDAEYPVTSFTLYYTQPAEPLRTVEDYREGLVAQLFNAMLNERLDEIARRPAAPFVAASSFEGSLVRPASYYGLGAQVQDDSVRAGLAAVLTEAERVRRHGFTATELAREKQSLLRAYLRAYNERDNTNSNALADEYVSLFLEQEAAPGIAYEYALVQRLLPAISLEEVNARAAALLEPENRAVVVTMPQKEGLTPPTEADLAAVLEAVGQRPIAPYVDDVSDAPLLATIPDPAPIAARTTHEAVGVTEVTLANGVRVVMKPTDFKEDEVRFTAFSPGGSSLVPDEDFLEASVAATLVDQSGVGPFTLTELQKKLSGKVVSATPYIAELEEGFNGAASPDDLETLFQLIHLYFTAPRADSSALAAFQNQQRAFLANRNATPLGAFQDTLIAALYGNHPRRGVPTLAQIEALSLADAFRLYRDRFADAGDFTFVFVGSFDVGELTALAQTYLGTLPATPREESWRDVAPDLPAGVVTRAVYKGVAPQSQVLLLYHGPLPYDRANRHALRSLADVLTIRLREELREDRGGVYGVGVQAVPVDRPDPFYQLVINFATDPARVEELVAAVQEQIARIQREGVPAELVQKVQEQQRRERETQLKTNAFWLGVLDFHYNHPEEPLDDVLAYPALIDGLTPARIQEAARRFLAGDRYVQAVLYPEAAAPEGAR